VTDEDPTTIDKLMNRQDRIIREKWKDTIKKELDVMKGLR
jgi:hypothetical protein